MNRAPSGASPTSRSRAQDPGRSSHVPRTTRASHVRPLGRPILELDLVEEAALLRQEAGWQHAGHSAKTLVKQRDLSITLIAMKQGTQMKEHQARGGLAIHVLVGRLQVQLGKQVIELPAGRLLALAGSVRHEIAALDDSVFILDVCADHSRPPAR